MKIIDGKLVFENVKERLKKEVAGLIDKGINPHLVAILVGSDPASQTYVGAKEKASAEIGILSTVYRYEESISEQELIKCIQVINDDEEVHGLIVQLPLPKHISTDKVINTINPKKDVDGFHPENFGRMALDLPSYFPATPNGILELIKYYNIETSGKHCVVLGRSNIVGRPISLMMAQKKYPGDSTVTVCHTRTKNLNEIARSADILIAAMGFQPLSVTKDMVKEGAVVIDVGIHRIEDKSKKSGFRLVGDVDYDNVAEKTSYITPVPGGVGPMTIASLLANTVKAAKKEIYH